MKFLRTFLAALLAVLVGSVITGLGYPVYSVLSHVFIEKSIFDDTEEVYDFNIYEGNYYKIVA